MSSVSLTYTHIQRAPARACPQDRQKDGEKRAHSRVFSRYVYYTPTHSHATYTLTRYAYTLFLLRKIESKQDQEKEGAHTMRGVDRKHKRERKRERETERERERQRETERHRDKETETYRHTDRQAD